MSTVRASTYQDASGGSNAVFSGVASPPNSMGFRNRLLNSDMRIDQRNAGASVSGTSGVYTVDRWKVQNNSGSARFNVQRNAGGVTPPVGFTNYLGITSTGAYSVASTDVIGIQQLVEGFNTADFGWGASGAATITLSFWVRSSLTGTFGGAILEGNAATASYPFSYTISAANTWEQKTVTVAGPTIGTWQTGSSTSIQLLFSMGTGSTYLGTAGSWSASSFYGATGQTNMVGTNGATFYITGVQLEAGTVASPFERRDYGRELIMCQRYFEKSYQQNVVPGSSGQGNTGTVLYVGTGNSVSNGDKLPLVAFQVVKRSAPTILTWSAAGTSSRLSNMAGTDLAASSCTPNVSSDKAFFAYQNSGGSVSGTSGCVEFHWTASAEL